MALNSDAWNALRREIRAAYNKAPKNCESTIKSAIKRYWEFPSHLEGRRQKGQKREDMATIVYGHSIGYWMPQDEPVVAGWRDGLLTELLEETIADAKVNPASLVVLRELVTAWLEANQPMPPLIQQAAIDLANGMFKPKGKKSQQTGQYWSEKQAAYVVLAVYLETDGSWSLAKSAKKSAYTLVMDVTGMPIGSLHKAYLEHGLKVKKSIQKTH